MSDEIFLFGTGKMSQKYTEFLRYLSIEIQGYIDNDPNKWGGLFYEKRIYTPEILKKIRPSVVIACASEKEIIGQLSQMGMRDKIVSIDHIIRGGIEAAKVSGECRYAKDKDCKKQTIIVDNLNGSWGGAEDWAHQVAQCLSIRGYDTIIVESTKAKTIKSLEKITVKIDKEDKNVYANLIKILSDKKPFTLINIWNSELLWTASYLKKVYLGEVQIISSVLNDHSDFYQPLYAWDHFIDLYICISSKIRSNLINLYRIREDKVYHREPFIKNKRNEQREFYVNNKDALKIGYPCRLIRAQKRTDLLPQLIEQLEKRNVNYILNIAGNGPYEKEIVKYIEDKHLRDKVKFYGKLSETQLSYYLEKQDIYLNFSEFEGTSLTMLEAMANGCVPVVTNVSGVDDFVQNRVNGMISDIGNIEDIAENILFLDQNREKLEEFGRKCVDIVSRKCKLNEYIDYLEKLIGNRYKK